MKDEFLSEEDLDLSSLSDAEFYAYWDLWLHQAQATNHLDGNLYSHGVFLVEPGRRPDGTWEDEPPAQPPDPKSK